MYVCGTAAEHQVTGNDRFGALKKVGPIVPPARLYWGEYSIIPKTTHRKEGFNMILPPSRNTVFTL